MTVNQLITRLHLFDSTATVVNRGEMNEYVEITDRDIYIEKNTEYVKSDLTAQAKGDVVVFDWGNSCNLD